ncbi:uncharacterized protein TNCV_3182211 [Trichonephila clavipes]|uniref:Uncharacterized protein n=1 Tax=Trichonephila clavipes TaxID=2585209 RepID=A0A8X6SHN2_TRICX|nr:uncharacterized protein TNCV_3182211 [Trichonephila clavipes]
MNSIRSDVSDAGISVSSKTTRSRLSNVRLKASAAGASAAGAAAGEGGGGGCASYGAYSPNGPYGSYGAYEPHGGLERISHHYGLLGIYPYYMFSAHDLGHIFPDYNDFHPGPFHPVQFPRTWQHSKQRRRWVGGEGSTCNGCRDPKCPSARRLRKVREDTGVPNEGATCAWMVADEAVGYTRSFLTMWWSSRRLVCRGRP